VSRRDDRAQRRRRRRSEDREPAIYLAVRCPECGAVPGRKCFNPRRGHLKGGSLIKGWHQPRIKAYITARERGKL